MSRADPTICDYEFLTGGAPFGGEKLIVAEKGVGSQLRREEPASR
jgi:hypothetical protein